MSDDWRQRFVVVAFKVGSVFSLFGTTYVMYEVLGDKKKRSKTYFRLLAGMCFIEFLESLVLFCGTWCTPSDWPWWGASGNMTTCNFQGFLNQVSVGSSMYSAFLALYYVLAIRYNVVERYIRKYLEPWMHAVALTWSFGTAIALLFLDAFRPLGTICYIGRTPPTCKQTFEFGYTDCEQGDNAQLYIMVFFYAWFFASFGFTLIAMLLVWVHIRSQENRMVRYNKETSEANRNLSQRFAIQGTLYVVVMWLCNVWTVISFTRIQMVGTGIIQISMMASVFKPLEGFFNFLIYIRPRLLKSKVLLTVSQDRAGTSTKVPSKVPTKVSEFISSFGKHGGNPKRTDMTGNVLASAERQENHQQQQHQEVTTSTTLSNATRSIEEDDSEIERRQDAEEHVELGAY